MQGRVQNSLHQLPNDLPTPQISIYNPSEAVVVSLAASSTTDSLGELSAIVTNDIVPAIEQVPGVSYVQENGNVTASIQVNVDPQKISASGFTLTDVINAIANNNVRAPGGIVYEPNRETNLDIRGDVQDVPTVANLLLGNSTTAATSTSSSSSVYPWTATSRLFRISDVANVQDAYETQRVYAYTNGHAGDRTRRAEGGRLERSHRVERSDRRSFHGLQPAVSRASSSTVLNVQSTYTEDLLSGVTRTLIEGILITAVVMLFFLRSWRKAVVVMIAVPASFLVTLAAMNVLGFTLDTVSLLGMTLDDRYLGRRLDRRPGEHFAPSRRRRRAATRRPSTASRRSAWQPS